MFSYCFPSHLYKDAPEHSKRLIKRLLNKNDHRHLCHMDKTEKKKKRKNKGKRFCSNIQLF